jgi:stearoyl-CoA desaturase (delta-9 desaturase)
MKFKIYWLFVFQLICAISLVPMFMYATWQNWLVTLVVYSFYGCIGATAIFHRLLTHKAYEAPKWFEYFGTLCGTLGGYGSSIAWVAIHRAHHRYVDTDRDPHSPTYKGWFNVQFLIMFNQPSIKLVPDLLRSKFHLMMHNYYWLVHAIYAGILYYIDPFAVVYAHLVPSFLIFHAGGLINNWGHTWGWQDHTGKDTSRNNPILGYLVFGEGWHNNHHNDPKKWNFSEKWWQLDLAALLIKGIKK